jgi:segregation and condensation protein B
MSQAAEVECLLFVAGEPLQLADLARAMQCDAMDVEEALRELQVELGARGSGLQVLAIAGGYQLATRTEYADTVARLAARSDSRLSRAALETLAVIAYRQPTTQPEIEAVRGVSVGGVLKTLQERRLIVDAGRKATMGRPILYVTTQEFLHYFGLKEIADLPPLDDADVSAIVGKVAASAQPAPRSGGADPQEPGTAPQDDAPIGEASS